MPDPRKISMHQKNLDIAISELVENLLNKNKDKQMTVAQLISLRENIVKDMHKFEVF